MDSVQIGHPRERVVQVSEDALRLVEQLFDRLPVMIHFTAPNGSTRLVNHEWERVLGWSLEELLAQRHDVWEQCYPDPDRRREVLEFMAAAEGVWREFKTTTKDGRVLDTSWVNVRLPDGTVVAMGRDITERKSAEEQRRRAEFYFTESQRLSRVGSWAWSPKTREPIFWSRELYRIFGFDPDDPAMGPQAVHRLTEARIHPEDWPAVSAAIGNAARTKSDFAVDYRIVLPNGTTTYVHGVGHAVLDESGELAELVGSVLDVTERKEAENERQRSLDRLRALAGRLESIREDERKRVAREIHDELGQALTAIKIDLSHLKHALPPEPERRFESILKNVDGTIKAVRRIATELRPGILDDLGLLAAVEWATEEFENRTGTKCEVSLPQCVAAIDQERATAIFRILQETLTNVARHANASHVDVQLTNQEGMVTLKVHDNGKGICEPQLSVSGSFGIQGMRERALILGGELDIRGVENLGTTVTVRIPVGEKAS